MYAIRPSDAIGDIRPVLHISDMVRGKEAIAKHVYYRLRLLVGEWWEYPEMGNQILQMFQTTRLSDSTADSLTSYFSTYIAETPGIFSIENAQGKIENRRYQYSCKALTQQGDVNINFETDQLY